MGKNYYELSDEFINMFDKIIKQTSIGDTVKVKFLGDNTLKDKFYEHKKIGDPFDWVFREEGSVYDLIIKVNETFFDELTDEHKEMLIVEMIHPITLKPKGGDLVLNIEKYDIQTYSGFLQKYGDIETISFKESLTSVMDKFKEEK